MKTPSGRLILIVFAPIAIASVVISCVTKPFCENKLFCITIGKPGQYVEISNKGKFDAALLALGEGNYDIYYKKDDSSDPVHPYHPSRVTLKTDRVTTSELAKNEPPGDPHVTQKVASNNPGKIQKVLDALVPPKP